MKKILPIALIFVYTLKTISAIYISIECSYKPNQRVWNVTESNFTVCDLQTNLGFSLVIDKATGLPTTVSNADVQVFIANQKDILRLPHNLEGVFPNLLGIKIESTNFMYLQPFTLRYFLNLKYLGITHSSLSVIYKGTFAYCTALELVDLTGNSIHYVSSSIFNDLKNLKFLYFNIYCLNENAYSGPVNSSIIANVRELIIGKCNDPVMLLDYFESTIYSLLKLFGHEVSYNSNNIEYFNATLEQLDQCRIHIDVLQYEVYMLNQTIGSLENQTCYPSGTCIYKIISEAYSCVAKLYVKTSSEQNINWTGIHASGQNNDAVMSLVIQSQVMEIFPLYIGTTFKNLKIMIVKNSGLTKIKANDFKGLTKLENLEITGNNIAVIDAAAFSGLTSLQKIDLSSNNITALPSQIFESLLSLKIINLSDNKLKQIRYDVISSANTIREIYLRNNAIIPLDRTFIWRLQEAFKIDLTGTGCPFSLDKEADTDVSFFAFYTDIIVNC